jgi:hypothetical protein
MIPVLVFSSDDHHSEALALGSLRQANIRTDEAAAARVTCTPDQPCRQLERVSSSKAVRPQKTLGVASYFLGWMNFGPPVAEDLEPVQCLPGLPN